MAVIAVVGHINVETTLRVDGFPVAYTPARYPFFGIQSAVSGVGFNVAAALTTLGSTVRLASIIGRDPTGALVAAALSERGIGSEWVLVAADATAQSVVLFDPEGRRQVNTDLKDMQEMTYPADRFARALSGCSLAVVGNINYARPLLHIARAAGLPLATDVHAIADLDDPYNRDYMAAADILFMSGERLPEPPEAWAGRVMDRYTPEILVIGLGAGGALLATKRDGRVERMPAVRTRDIVSTVGAGDALFAAFLHCYAETGEPATALRKATVFASSKIGAAGGAEGFLDARALDALTVALGHQATGAPSG